MSLRKDQKVNRSLTDEIRMLGTAVYLGNVLFQVELPSHRPVIIVAIRYDDFLFSSLIFVYFTWK